MVHNTSKALSSLPKLYKSHKRSRKKQKSPYSKKVETTNSPQVGNVKKRGSMWSLAVGMNHHARRIPQFLFHVTKIDLWHVKVPQTLWQ